MEDIPDFSNEQIAIFANAKNAVLRETDKYRVGIRKTLSRDSIQNFFDNEKPAAFGLVSGALVATFLWCKATITYYSGECWDWNAIAVVN